MEFYIEEFGIFGIIFIGIICWFGFIAPLLHYILYKPVGPRTSWGTYTNYVLRNKKLRDRASQKKQEKRKLEWKGYLDTINELSNKYTGYNIDKKSWSNNRYLLKLSWEEVDEKIEKLIEKFEENSLEYDKKKTPEENEKFLIANRIKIPGKRNGYI